MNRFVQIARVSVGVSRIACKERKAAGRAPEAVPDTAKLMSRMQRKVFLMLLVIAGLNAPSAMAQTPDGVRPPYRFTNEIFVGGNYTRTASGQNLNDTNFGGWNVSLTHYLTPIWGATVDVQGAYGHAPLNASSSTISDPFVYKHIFLAGPQIRWRRNEHFASSFRLLAGVVDSCTGSTPDGITPTALGLYPDATKVAFKPGGVLDYNLSRRVAVRLATGILFERQDGGFQRDFNIATGFVFRLGK